MSDILLAVESLTLVYGEAVRALNDFTMSVPEGQIVGLVGLNGAGKTSTVRAISGFSRSEHAHISAGAITFGGSDITGWRPDQTAHAGITLVPERHKIFHGLTVQENLDLVASPPTERHRPRRQSLDELFDLMPVLKDRRRQQAVFLSGGERQMLAIAAAALALPRLLIVDEASLGLAPQVVETIMEHLTALNRQFGTTVLVVDQNVRNVLAISDYAYVIEHGSVSLEGPAEELRSHSDVQGVYLGKGGDPGGYGAFRATDVEGELTSDVGGEV